MTEHLLPPGLSIGELSRRTGVPAATLRSWENRYGVPRPPRAPSGRRRYREEDVAAVQAVLRHRDAGLSLRRALEAASEPEATGDASVFAGLRRRFPDLQAHVLSKRTMLALSRAIEDECCARAERPVIFASFQRPAFYRASRHRWEELARTAELVVVFATFRRTSTRGRHVRRIPLAADSPLRREWVLVCDAPDYPACLAGWELMPSNGRSASREGSQEPGKRRFEGLWSVDPTVVRSAATICAGVARGAAPDLSRRLASFLDSSVAPASADLRRATGLLNRTVAYLEGVV